MTATLENIWQVPAYLPYVQPPLTKASVKAAETKIGHKLPIEFLNLLRKQNGGYIRFSLPGTVHRTIAGIGPHFPSLTDFDWNECRESVSFPLQGLVPFDGDGHWHLCLDYRKATNSPKVSYVDIECNRQSTIANSFGDYLDKLRLDVKDDFVIEEVLDKVKAQLSKVLRIKFEPPDTWAHGYPVHRASLGTQRSPQWLWISPNTVPRGFVRRDDKRYRALKHLMQGAALRFPEVPATASILTATDAVQARVVRACLQSQLLIRPLSEYLE